MIKNARKLAVVADAAYVRLFEAVGFKITKLIMEGSISELSNNSHNNNDHQPDHFFKTSSSTGHFADLQEHAKNLERQDSAKFIASYLNKIVENDRDYKELIIVAEPKILGHLRKYLSKNLKSIVSKEIAKDLIRVNINDIQETVFA